MPKLEFVTKAATKHAHQNQTLKMEIVSNQYIESGTQLAHGERKNLS